MNRYFKWMIGGLAVLSAAALSLFIWRSGDRRLLIRDEILGVGEVSASEGCDVLFHYELYVLKEGRRERRLESTYERHQARRLRLGAHQVVSGLEQALVGMKPGGRRHVLIPASLAYGSEGAADGLVPARAPLEAVLEMKAIL